MSRRLYPLVAAFATVLALGSPLGASAGSGAAHGVNVFAPFVLTPTCAGAETVYFQQAVEPWTGLFKSTGNHAHFSGHTRLYGSGGVGETSGASYHFNSNLVQVNLSGGRNNAFGTLFLSSLTLVRERGGLSYRLRMLMHFRATPSGLQTSVQKISWSC